MVVRGIQMKREYSLKYNVKEYMRKVCRILLFVGYSCGLSGCIHAEKWNMTIKPKDLPTRRNSESGNLEGKVAEGTNKTNSSE